MAAAQASLVVFEVIDDSRSVELGEPLGGVGVAVCVDTGGSFEPLAGRLGLAVGEQSIGVRVAQSAAPRTRASGSCSSRPSRVRTAAPVSPRSRRAPDSTICISICPASSRSSTCGSRARAKRALWTTECALAVGHHGQVHRRCRSSAGRP